MTTAATYARTPPKKEYTKHVREGFGLIDRLNQWEPDEVKSFRVYDLYTK